MNDEFRRLNIRRRKTDQWGNRMQKAMAIAIGICIVSTVIAQVWMRFHK